MSTWMEAVIVVLIMIVSVVGGPIVIGSLFLIVLLVGYTYKWLIQCKRTKTGFWEE